MPFSRLELIEIAAEQVQLHVAADPTLKAAYLCGSVLDSPEENLYLGGAVDIDLVFVHASRNDWREIVPLQNGLHLDIAHHSEDLYQPPRGLRTQAWMGTTVYDFKIMHDPSHFLEFIQAGVRGLFYRPDFAWERIAGLILAARQLWEQGLANAGRAGARDVWNYFQALEHAANAVACLTGPPMTERRFPITFTQRAGAAGHPGLEKGLAGLLGGNRLPSGIIQSWLPKWEHAYDTVSPQKSAPAALHPARKAYYLHAIHALLEEQQQDAALWLLMRTWTRSAIAAPYQYDLQQAWTEACDNLNILGEHYNGKLEALDAYLGTVEDILAAWRETKGL